MIQVENLVRKFGDFTATLMGRSHFGLTADALVLVAVGTVLLFVGTYLFSKIEV